MRQFSGTASADSLLISSSQDAPTSNDDPRDPPPHQIPSLDGDDGFSVLESVDSSTAEVVVVYASKEDPNAQTAQTAQSSSSSYFKHPSIQTYTVGGGLLSPSSPSSAEERGEQDSDDGTSAKKGIREWRQKKIERFLGILASSKLELKFARLSPS